MAVLRNRDRWTQFGHRDRHIIMIIPKSADESWVDVPAYDLQPHSIGSQLTTVRF